MTTTCYEVWEPPLLRLSSPRCLEHLGSSKHTFHTCGIVRNLCKSSSALWSKAGSETHPLGLPLGLSQSGPWGHGWKALDLIANPHLISSSLFSDLSNNTFFFSHFSFHLYFDSCKRGWQPVWEQKPNSSHSQPRIRVMTLPVSALFTFDLKALGGSEEDWTAEAPSMVSGLNNVRQRDMLPFFTGI